MAFAWRRLPSQSNARSASVWHNKLNSGLFERRLHRMYGSPRHVASRLLKINDCRQPKPCRFRKLRLGDVQQRARSATLSGCDRMSNTY
jgi:hypothetical protein